MNSKQLQPHSNIYPSNTSFYSTSPKQTQSTNSFQSYQPEFPTQGTNPSFSPNFSSIYKYPANSQPTRPRKKIFDPLIPTVIPPMTDPTILNQSFSRNFPDKRNNIHHTQRNPRPNIHFNAGVQQHQQLGPSLLPKNRISEGDSTRLPKIYSNQPQNNFQQEINHDQAMNNSGNYPYNNNQPYFQNYPTKGYHDNFGPGHQQSMNSFKSSSHNSQLNQYPLHFDPATHPDLDTSYTSTATTKTSRRRIKPIVVMNINIGNGEKAEIQIFEGNNPSEVARNFCQSYNLPPSLIQILTDNITTQVNNYYKLREQKMQKFSTSPTKTENFKKNFETFVQDEFQESGVRSKENFHENEEPYQFEDIEPRLSERASTYQPVPHDYTPNPALKQSIQQNDFVAFRSQHNYQSQNEQREYKDNMEWQSPEKASSRRKSFATSERTSPEFIPQKKGRSKTPTQGHYYRKESQEVDQDENDNFNVSDKKPSELQEIEEEIKKLKLKKQKLYFEKFKTSSVDDFVDERVQNSQATKASIKDFETYQLESLEEYGETSPNTYNSQKLNQQNLQGNFSNWETDQSQSDYPKSKSYLTHYVDEERRKKSFMDKVKNEKNKKDREERERENSPNGKRNFSPQFQIVENKTHSLVVQPNTSATPHNSNAKKNYNQNDSYPKNYKKSFNEDSFSNDRSSYRSNKSSKIENARERNRMNTSNESFRYEELKKKVLDDIFACLDNDSDGRISMSNIDISGIHPEVLENLSEIFGALEDDMVLTYNDFINMVNHRKLVEVFQKIYGSRGELDSQRNSEIGFRM